MITAYRAHLHDLGISAYAGMKPNPEHKMLTAIPPNPPCW